MNFIDNYRHKGLRKQLISELREKQIASEEVLQAMGKIPRHIFIDDVFLEHIYQDKAFPIGNQQTISHPSTVAYQSTLLNLAKTDVVLEVGTGSGYQTLVLAQLAGFVLSIERQRELYQKTRKLLPAFKHRNMKLFYGDGYKGLPNYAPFNKIIVTCGAEEIPNQLVAQLKPMGRMIVPVGGKQEQTMIIIDKDETGEITIRKGKDFRFVPMLKGKNR